jgi:hypothetical protein
MGIAIIVFIYNQFISGMEIIGGKLVLNYAPLAVPIILAELSLLLNLLMFRSNPTHSIHLVTFSVTAKMASTFWTGLRWNEFNFNLVIIILMLVMIFIDLAIFGLGLKNEYKNLIIEKLDKLGIIPSDKVVAEEIISKLGPPDLWGVATGREKLLTTLLSRFNFNYEGKSGLLNITQIDIQSLLLPANKRLIYALGLSLITSACLLLNGLSIMHQQ